MAYWLYTYRYPNAIEYEYKYVGNYGAKGEKRKKKSKPTPEQMKKINQLNREKKIRRIIEMNFFPDDLWTTLKYPEGKRKPVWEIEKDLTNFIDSLRGKYKRRGHVLKFVVRMEIGERGGIHIHILIPRIRGGDTDILVQGSWKHGRVNFQSIYEMGGYEKLANYIVKQPKEEAAEQLSLFPEEERKKFIKYSCSRNLVRPVPEKKKYRKWTLRKLIKEGPKETKGFWIDKNSIFSGKNPYDGYSYLYYTERRIKTIKSREEWERFKKGGSTDG